MFKRRKIPERNKCVAHAFAIAAIKAAGEARESGARIYTRGGGATVSSRYRPAPLRRYELRRIRKMMWDIYGE